MVIDYTGLDQTAYFTKAKKELLGKFPSSKIIEDKKMNINGQEAHIINSRAQIVAGLETCNLQIMIVNKGRVYIITGSTLNSTWDKYKNIIDASLLSFEIINEDVGTVKVIEDFSSPESTWKIHLEAWKNKDIELYLKTISEKAKEKAEEELLLSEYTNTNKWDKEYNYTNLLKKARYKIIEQSDMFAIMAPESRMQSYHSIDSGLVKTLPMADTYFEYENGSWKIDIVTTFYDVYFRTMFNQETADEVIKKLKDEWHQF